MWPFTYYCKKNSAGVSRGKNGEWQFTFTDEEKEAIEEQLDLLKGYAVHPDYVDKLNKVMIARGLAKFAEKLIILSVSDFKLIEKACATIGKAITIHPLPIYIYDLAIFMEMFGEDRMTNMAKETFKKFLDTQSTFKPDQLDNIILSERDVDEAIRNAKSKV